MNIYIYGVLQLTNRNVIYFQSRVTGGQVIVDRKVFKILKIIPSKV